MYQLKQKAFFHIHFCLSTEEIEQAIEFFSRDNLSDDEVKVYLNEIIFRAGHCLRCRRKISLIFLESLVDS